MKDIISIFLLSVLTIGIAGCGEGSDSPTTPPPSPTPTPVPTVTPEPPIAPGTAFDAPIIDNIVKQAYLDAINNVRASAQDCGTGGMKPAVSALVWNDALYRAAYEHSEDLAESDTLSHDGSGTASDWTAQIKNLSRGSTALERIENNGYINWNLIGENITAGTNQDLVEEAIAAWLASDIHCANLMNPIYKDVGMGHVEKSSSLYTHYWTQDFGAK